MPVTDRIDPSSGPVTTPGKESNLQMVQDKESDDRELNKRQDDDKDLYLLTEYKMLRQDGTEVPFARNVTMNDARTFADRAIAIVSGANMQRQAEGKALSDRELKVIEDWMDDLFTTVDLSLMKRGMGRLHNFSIEQDIVRGFIGSRNLVWQDSDSGLMVPDILPLDTRYLYYEYSGDKLLWAAPKFWRSKAQIESEYEAEAKKFKARVLTRNNVVYDFWNDKVNEVFVNGKKIVEKENPLGYPPFVIQASGSGSMFMDKGHRKYRGESIFAPVRSLYPQINLLASILQTLNFRAFAGGYTFPNEEGADASAPEKGPYEEFVVIPVGKTEGYQLIPVQDIKQATRLFFSLVMSAIQRGSFPNIDYGNLTFPLSAVAIKNLQQTRDTIIWPRMDALSLYYQATTLMMKDQYVRGKVPMKLGRPGIENEYKPSDIEKPFTPVYKFYAISPDQDVANTAIAQQQLSIGMPMEYILRETMKVQDPSGMMMAARSERAEKTDAAISLFRLCHSQVEEAKRTHNDDLYIEADLNLQQLEIILRNRASGGAAGVDLQTASQPAQMPKPLVPLMGGGQGGRQNVPPEEEMNEDVAERESRSERRATTVRKQTEEG